MRRAYRHLQPRSLRAQLALLLLGAAGVALLAFLGLAGVLSSPSHDLMDKLDAWGLDLALALTAAVCVIVAVLASALFARHIRRVFGHLTTAAIRRGGLGGAAASGEPSDIVDPDPHEAEFEDAYQNVAGAIDDLAGRLQLLAGHVAQMNLLADSLQETDRHERFRQLADQVASIFPADAAALVLLARDEEDGEAVFVSSNVTEAETRSLRRGAGGAMRSLQTFLIGPDAGVDRGEAAQPATTPRAMACPLAVGDEVLGAVAIACVSPGSFSRQDVLVLSTVAGQLTVALRNAEVIDRLEATNLETVRALAAAMEAKDAYTAEHAESLALSSVAVGLELGLGRGDLRRLEYAALLHDIGKIGVSRSILNKPSALTNAEFAEIAQHTILGERISAQVEDLRPVARVIRSAHERYDGHGYPDGLAGEAIPLLSRILLVCDAFDAMTSNRPYRRALPADVALAEVKAGAGVQFDPRVVDALARVCAQAAGRRRRPEMPIYIWHGAAATRDSRGLQAASAAVVFGTPTAAP